MDYEEISFIKIIIRMLIILAFMINSFFLNENNKKIKCNLMIILVS